MKVILFGATGMVLTDYAAIEPELAGHDACLFLPRGVGGRDVRAGLHEDRL